MGTGEKMDSQCTPEVEPGRGMIDTDLNRDPFREQREAYALGALHADDRAALAIQLAYLAPTAEPVLDRATACFTCLKRFEANPGPAIRGCLF